MRNIQKKDADMIHINSVLRRNYGTLSNSVGEYANIIGVFYHELICYLTNYYILKNSSNYYNSPISFPFLNTSYVNNPTHIAFDQIETSGVSRRLKVFGLVEAFFKPLPPLLAICSNENLLISELTSNN